MAARESYPRLIAPDHISMEWNDLFTRLREVNTELTQFYTIRQETDSLRLPDADFARERELLMQKGELFADFLSFRRNGSIPLTPVTIIQAPREIFHPFSQNFVSILLPVPEEPERAITSKLKVSQIRKAGVVNSNDDAFRLIGSDYKIEGEDPKLSLNRCIEEIEYARDAEKTALQNGHPDEVRYALNRLRCHLIIDRLIDLRVREAVPEGYDIGVGFLSAALLDDKMAHLVEVLVNTPGGRKFAFTLLRPHAYRKHDPGIQMKLHKALDAIKGYDYYGYRRPRDENEKR